MSIKDVMDFINSSPSSAVAIFFLLTAIFTHNRKVWVWAGDCNKRLEEKDEEIERLRVEAAISKRRLEDDNAELFQLAIHGTSQAAAALRAAMQAGKKRD